jgi:hypothetical protein
MQIVRLNSRMFGFVRLTGEKLSELTLPNPARTQSNPAKSFKNNRSMQKQSHFGRQTFSLGSENEVCPQAHFFIYSSCQIRPNY